MLETRPEETRSFVYVSAADAFAPVVPARYISTKREAEQYILSHCTPQTGVLPVIVRPGELPMGKLTQV